MREYLEALSACRRALAGGDQDAILAAQKECDRLSELLSEAEMQEMLENPGDLVGGFEGVGGVDQ